MQEPTADYDDEMDDEQVYANDDSLKFVPPSSIPLESLQQYVLDKLNDGSLPLEFAVSRYQTMRTAKTY